MSVLLTDFRISTLIKIQLSVVNAIITTIFFIIHLNGLAIIAYLQGPFVNGPNVVANKIRKRIWPHHHNNSLDAWLISMFLSYMLHIIVILNLSYMIFWKNNSTFVVCSMSIVMLSIFVAFYDNILRIVTTVRERNSLFVLHEQQPFVRKNVRLFSVIYQRKHRNLGS